MSSVKNILGIPQEVESVGKLYPIQMKHYDEFMDNANVLTLTYDHFNVNEIKKQLGMSEKEEIKLLDLILLISIQSEEKHNTLNTLATVLKLVLRIDEIKHDVNDEGLCFFFGESGLIDRNNFDEIKKIIMEQNLLHEQKVFKNEIVQKWAENVLKQRAKNSIDMTIEDKITTVATFSSKHYWDIGEYSIYQLDSEFARIGKFKAFETGLHLIGHAENPTKDHYAESTDIHKSPYDDLFVGEGKLNKMKDTL